MSRLGPKFGGTAGDAADALADATAPVTDLRAADLSASGDSVTTDVAKA